MTYNLTNKQKDLLQALVNEVRKGKLEEEFIVVWTLQGGDIIGFDGNPPEITRGSFSALANNGLILMSPQKYSDQVTLLGRAYEAVDSEFADITIQPPSLQVSMNGATINMQSSELNVASIKDSHHISTQVANLPSEVLDVFNRLLDMAHSLSDQTEKSDAEKAIEILKAESEKGDNAVEKTITKWLNFLIETSPDIGDVAIASFINPALGFGMVFKKVAEKVKSKLKE